MVPSADAGSGDTVPLPSATPSGSWRETLDVPEVSGVLRQISASEQLVEAMAAGGGSGAFRTAGVGVVYRSAPWDGVQLDRMAGSTEIEFVSDEPLPWYDDPRCRVAVIACCAVIPLVVRWLLH